MSGKNFDLKKEGIIEKISYESRAYESVEPLLGYVSKINGKENSGTNGLILSVTVVTVEDNHPKFQFQSKKGSTEKFPMSVASMSL